MGVARKINYMYNHTKLPPINPVKKDVINTKKNEMYHKIEFEIFPDREEVPQTENANLLSRMNENLKQHTINRSDPARHKRFTGTKTKNDHGLYNKKGDVEMKNFK